jgi:aminopeptidase N
MADSDALVPTPPPAEADLLVPGVSEALARHRRRTLSEPSYELLLRIPRDPSDPIEAEVELQVIWDDPLGLPLVLDFAPGGGPDPVREREALRSVEVNGVTLAPGEVVGWGARSAEAGMAGAVSGEGAGDGAGDVGDDEAGDKAGDGAEGGHLRIEARHLQAGARNTIRLSVLAGDGPLNRREDLLYALFVPARAHHALPVLDQPDLKARVRWTLEIPGDWEAVANGGRARVTELAGPEGEPRVRIEGHPTGPIPTYLMSFAAGAIERVERTVVDPGGTPRTLVLFHRETDPRRRDRNLDAILALHAEALHGLEAWTGIPYPYAHPLDPRAAGEPDGGETDAPVELPFTAAAIPAFQYGGMEHPGAVWYRAESLFLDENATQAQLLGRASLIAHETAHMWFGNLVTMAWFDDVWTKEVFANFLAARLVNPSFPEVDHELRFLLAHHPAAYGVDRTAGTHPIRQPLENLDHAGSLYGPIIYQKAPVAMRQLERRMGEEAFRRGVRRYLEEHAHGNATWGDLVRILDAESPRDLEGWSRDWIDGRGRPTIRVEAVRGGYRLRSEPGAPEGGAPPPTWPQLLDPAWVGPGGVDALPEVEVGSSGDARGPVISVPAGEGFLLPDAGGYGYALFRLEAEALRRLLDALADPGGRLQGTPRASALLVAYDAVLEGDLPAGALVEAILARIPHEPDEQLLSRGLGVVTSLLDRLLEPGGMGEGAAARDAGGEERLRARAEAVLLEELRAGPPPRRSAALFGALREVARTPETVRWLEALHRGEVEIPGFSLGEADRTALALTLAILRPSLAGEEGAGIASWDGILDREEARITDPDRRARFRWLRPAVNPDPEVREVFFQGLAQAEGRAREPWVVQGLALLHHPLRHQEPGGEERLLRWLDQALELLPEIRETGDIFFPTQWLGAVMSGHRTPEAVGVTDAFLARTPELDPRLREKVLQAGDPVRRAAALASGASGSGG